MGIAEAGRVLQPIMRRYPAQKSLNLPMPSPNEIVLFKVTPEVISVLVYSLGFGHTDLVECPGADAHRRSSVAPSRGAGLLASAPRYR